MSGYHNWSGNTVTPVTLVNNLPAGGGDVVHSQYHLRPAVSYTLSDKDWLGDQIPGAQFFVDIQNISDKAPAFYNSAAGYDGYTGNPIGRLVTLECAPSSDRPVSRDA